MKAIFIFFSTSCAGSLNPFLAEIGGKMDSNRSRSVYLLFEDRSGRILHERREFPVSSAAFAVQAR